jgi:cell division protease FtsH
VSKVSKPSKPSNKPPGKKPENTTSWMKNLGFIIVLAAFGGVAYVSSKSNTPKLKDIALSEVVSRANKGELKDLVVTGDQIEVTENGQEKATLKSLKPANSLKDEGLDFGKVNVTYKKPSENGNLINLGLTTVLPFVFLALLMMWFLKQAQSQGNNNMSFGKSKARLYGNEKETVAFKDIAGNAEAKQDLSEVVEFLKTPQKFEVLGAKIPKGVLLVGPPGTGKTMIARAVAGEAGVPFFSISGSEFVEMFVGVGASRVRDLFAKAKKNSPCIIFIDEIDAVGRKRGSGMGGGHDEREQTLNQILVEMDGFEQGTTVIVLAATNRADVLDKALLRPGRFDRRVMIGLPERNDREAILKVHFEKKPLDKKVRLDELAKKTGGMAGADLANLANESAIVAARSNKTTIEESDVTEAFERVAIGPERKNKVMTEKERELTAYHEGGHALVGHVLPNTGYIHKVTIISRGQTGGVTWSLDEDEKSYHSVAEYRDSLARV